MEQLSKVRRNRRDGLRSVLGDPRLLDHTRLTGRALSRATYMWRALLSKLNTVLLYQLTHGTLEQRLLGCDGLRVHGRRHYIQSVLQRNLPVSSSVREVVADVRPYRKLRPS